MLRKSIPFSYRKRDGTTYPKRKKSPIVKENITVNPTVKKFSIAEDRVTFLAIHCVIFRAGKIIKTSNTTLKTKVKTRFIIVKYHKNGG